MSLNMRIDKESVLHLHKRVSLRCLKKKTYIMKFAGKWIELEKKIILSDVTQIQKDIHGMYSLISGY